MSKTEVSWTTRIVDVFVFFVLIMVIDSLLGRSIDSVMGYVIKACFEYFIFYCLFKLFEERFCVIYFFKWLLTRNGG